IDDCKIERVFSFKYLGVILDPNLMYNLQFDYVAKRLDGAIGRLHVMKRFVSTNVLKLLVNAYADSIIDFCLIIWAVQPPEQLNTLFCKILRFLTFVNYPLLLRKAAKQRLKNRYTIRRFNALEMINKYKLVSVTERRDIQTLK